MLMSIVKRDQMCMACLKKLEDILFDEMNKYEETTDENFEVFMVYAKIQLTREISTILSHVQLMFDTHHVNKELIKNAFQQNTKEERESVKLYRSIRRFLKEKDGITTDLRGM